MVVKNIKQKRSELYNKVITDSSSINKLHNSSNSKYMSSTQSDITENKEVSDTESNSVENNIISWLTKLRLLYGVPFEYLVINEEMLPVESIKFFYLDHNWITSLIDGAYSIGRATVSEEAHDNAFSCHVNLGSHKESSRFRAQAFGLEGTNNTMEVITGFLLRSSVVSQWPGLEVSGYSEDPSSSNSSKLDILRMDHISPSIILCLFAGEVNYLRINNPPEDLHFGFDPKSKNDQDFQKILKNADGTQNKENTLNINSSFYRDQNKEGKNVIKMAALTEEIKTRLSVSEFTSSAFALQMVVGVDTPELQKHK